MILASLVRAYDRLKEKSAVPTFGYARTNIAFSIRIDPEGKPACAPIDLRQANSKGNKLVGLRKEVPTFLSQRTSGIEPNFLWDKTSYVLGVDKFDPKRPASKREKDALRLLEMHRSFVELHKNYLADETDPGLVALLRFLERWNPEHFSDWPSDMLGENVVFELVGEERQYVHERPAAVACWAKVLANTPAINAVCLIDGSLSRASLSHPPIKNVDNAQTSGAFIVSFNQNAFKSYGHDQGDNAPVSELSAFKYTTALNLFLERNSGHRIQIGDASTVFWADASGAESAKQAEDFFAALLEPIDENTEAKRVEAILENIRLGRDAGDYQPYLPKNVRFHVLGLAPNAARLSIRFYIEDDFGRIAQNFLAHFARLRIEPLPDRDVNPPLWRYLIETASQKKSENVPPNLAGEFLRAILTGAPYPRSLLPVLLMRLRADKDVNALRVALLKALLLRNHSSFATEAPVSLDPTIKDPGYLLGRLFATYEYVQTQALGGNVNATIRDQYYGTASATPRAVFPILQRKATHHLSRLRKDKPGLAVNLDKDIGEIFELAEAEKLFTPTLTAQRQALFAIGYYHQRNKFFRPRDEAKADANS